MADSKLSTKKLQSCQQCDAAFSIAKTKCPKCGFWNTPTMSHNNDETVLLSEAEDAVISTIQTGPWDRCFSNNTVDEAAKPGLVLGGLYLFGGAPGAGKSTLSLQIANEVAGFVKEEVLYIAKEENVAQVKDRAKRLQLSNLNLIRIYPITAKYDLGEILMSRRPKAVFVDSLSRLTGNPEMAVETCNRFKDYAVGLNAPIVLIDHINKEGDFAGLMALQHGPDCLITLFNIEGNNRNMASHKNRFGESFSLDLVMTGRGLHAIEKEEE